MGTGRFLSLQQPSWLWSWLQWTLGELLRSPGEQQTEIVRRHFSELVLYRIDPHLDRRVELDDVGALAWLREYSERFAAEIDWAAILSGADDTFRIEANRTQWVHYSRPTTSGRR